jgi:hypothetical protein
MTFRVLVAVAIATVSSDKYGPVNGRQQSNWIGMDSGYVDPAQAWAIAYSKTDITCHLVR